MAMPANITWLDIGLNADDQAVWHHLSEGSELVPMSVLEAIKSPRTGKPFLFSLADYGFMVENPDPHLMPSPSAGARKYANLRRSKSPLSASIARRVIKASYAIAAKPCASTGRRTCFRSNSFSWICGQPSSPSDPIRSRGTTVKIQLRF